MPILTPSIAAQRKERQLLHSMEPEPFVAAIEAGTFLRCAPVTAKRLAREGKSPATPSRMAFAEATAYCSSGTAHRGDRWGGANRSFYS